MLGAAGHRGCRLYASTSMVSSRPRSLPSPLLRSWNLQRPSVHVRGRLDAEVTTEIHVSLHAAPRGPLELLVSSLAHQCIPHGAGLLGRVVVFSRKALRNHRL